MAQERPLTARRSASDQAKKSSSGASRSREERVAHAIAIVETTAFSSTTSAWTTPRGERPRRARQAKRLHVRPPRPAFEDGIAKGRVARWTERRDADRRAAAIIVAGKVIAQSA